MQRPVPADQRPTAGMSSWARVLFIAGAATLAGALAAPIAFVVGLLANDPVDVVGRPLVDGYSERGESTAWFVFLLATTIFSLGFERRVRSSWIATLAVIPPVLVLWQQTWVGLALYVTVGIAAFALAKRASFGVGFVIWLVVYPWITWEASVAVLLTAPLALI